MNQELKTKIAESLKSYLSAHGMSQNKFCEQTGINVAYVSALCNGEHKVGDTPIASKYYTIISEKIGISIAKEFWKPVVTVQLQRVLATLEEAQEYGYTNIIIGETGSGKTYATDLFCASHPLDVYKVTVSQQDTIGDLIDKVLEKIKVPSSKSRSKRINDIVKHMRNLKHQGYKPMLIFDEAEYMKQPSLCAMKEFYDNLNGVCSIVMIGTNQLLRSIDKLRKKNTDGIPQLYRRIKFGIRELSPIDRSFKDFADLIQDKGVLQFVRTHCDNFGELHDVLVPALREADRLGENITENLVRTILNMPKL
ncbi:MAG TPA: AAA family ATPase [Bacteroidales bacterium]|nr:AAA family ATPase [Bacteroidales bacterium]HRS19657.1 AAA family ATPase [Bacteroidales bacterium]